MKTKNGSNDNSTTNIKTADQQQLQRQILQLCKRHRALSFCYHGVDVSYVGPQIPVDCGVAVAEDIDVIN